jgi:SAM-dependent methyltransferase
MRRFIRLSIVAGVVLTFVGLALRASGIGRKLMDRQFPEGEMKPTGWFASVYGTTSPWFGRWLYALFAKRLELRPEDRVLDVACGSGGFLRIYGSHAQKIAGIDHSEDLIAIAKRQNRDRVAAGTAEFVTGDATELPWDEGEFTAVTCNCIDCFADKAKPALAEMYRVLRPGGRVLVTENHQEDMESVGFSRASAEHIGWGYLTIGYKEAV